MSKLLSANFMRLKKNGLFWGVLITMFAFGTAMVFQQLWEQVKYAEFGETGQMDLIFFRYAIATGLMMAVFIPLFFGTEYSDGTLRNKIMVGHSRTSIYFADLLTGIGVSVLLCAAYLLPVMILGPVFIEFLTMDVRFLLMILMGTLVMGAAFSSVYILITMNCSRKAATAVGCVLLAVFLLVVATYVNALLENPEFIPVYSLAADGAIVNDGMEPNPRYLQGTARTVCEFLYDFLPAGQAIQYSSMSAVHLWQMPLHSLVITVLSTAAGVLLFRRKDLK